MGNVFTRSLQSAYQTKKPPSRFALMAESRNDALLLLTAFTSRAQKLCLRHKLSNFFWIAFQIGHGAAFGQRPAGPGLGSLNSSKWAHTAQSRFMVWRQCLFASSKPSPHQPECVFHLISRRGLVWRFKGAGSTIPDRTRARSRKPSPTGEPSNNKRNAPQNRSILALEVKRGTAGCTMRRSAVTA